ncbi:LysR family transcriptional regulator [Glaciecola petra]|uniref:LysR family transcriptional regulator n=1 Tax=Glaciecola petra TaxID=3075602 RepID=A0ABU2ZLN6_9ALTE|nr:LysR family transcriptional regulator [Aestuariibacter sp. P117]MDT0593537.1 LysR family transcriptional regulator [Aestuariibacter sp. P117]
MQNLSLTVLRTFVTCVELGNFHKAGDLLGRSQPAVSLQIKKLESQLQRKLFNKVGQSYKVNNDGEKLFAYAQNMLALNDEIFNTFNTQTLRGRLRLGIPSEFASAILPSIIGEFSQRYPEVSLDVTSALSQHLLAPNSIQQFDLILALLNSDENTRILSNAHTIRKDELVWVAYRNIRLPHDSLPLVLAPEGCIYRQQVIEHLKRQTHLWKITYTNPDFYGLIAAMKQGLGITVLARSIVPDELVIVKDKRLPKLPKVDICLINQDNQHPQVSKALSDYIKTRLTP